MGLTIRRLGELATPIIDLSAYYQEYLNGKSGKEILENMAQFIVLYEDKFLHDLGINAFSIVHSYEKAREYLGITLCDPVLNGNRLENVAWVGNDQFAGLVATFQIQLPGELNGSIPVTDQMMQAWHVTHDMLLRDALEFSEKRDKPVLANLMNITASALSPDIETVNYLEPDNRQNATFLEAYCFTNESKFRGASLIIDENLMQEIGDVIQDDFYVLPSSIHEVMVIPSAIAMNLDSMSEMVRSINETIVDPKDILSNEVMFYDRDAKSLSRAADYFAPQIDAYDQWLDDRYSDLER